MKTVRALYELLNSKYKLEERHPMLDTEDHKIHVLFLSAFMNESGYYRTILPALELNKTQSHCAIVANLRRWDFHKFVDSYDLPIYSQLAQWAHYIVLPAMFVDTKEFIGRLRTENPNADIVMDIDLNYDALPAYHPGSKLLPKEVREVLVKNVGLVDIVTAPNTLILERYQALMDRSGVKHTYYSEQYSNLVSNIALEEVSGIFKNSGKKIRIGLLLADSLPEDLAVIDNVLKEIVSENSDKIELVIYGWRDKVRQRTNLLVGINVQFVPIANTLDFPVVLNKMAIDIGLIPYVDNMYNKSGTVFNRFLEFSTLMIPCIAPATFPFVTRINDGETGFLAGTPEEWKTKLTRLINEPQLRIDMGQAAQRVVWETWSYTNPKTIQRLTQVFA